MNQYLVKSLSYKFILMFYMSGYEHTPVNPRRLLGEFEGVVLAASKLPPHIKGSAHCADPFLDNDDGTIGRRCNRAADNGVRLAVQLYRP